MEKGYCSHEQWPFFIGYNFAGTTSAEMAEDAFAFGTAGEEIMYRNETSRFG